MSSPAPKTPGSDPKTAAGSIQKISSSAVIRRKRASPWFTISSSPSLRVPNPLKSGPPTFGIPTLKPNPLIQSPSASTGTRNAQSSSELSNEVDLPQHVVRVTLPMSLLDEDGDTVLIRPGGEVWNAIKNIFPTITEIGFHYPFLVVGVKELPPQPWPTFLGELPLWLTTTPRDLPFPSGITSRAHLSFRVDGDIQEGVNPSTETILEIFKLANGKGAGIDRIQWTGLQFWGLGKKEPASGWQNVVPSRINGFSMMYIWGKSTVQEHALRVKQPTLTRADDTEYFRSQLRPGVMLEGFSKAAGGSFSTMSTTSGVCVESPSGGKYITVAAHGFPAGIEDHVYQPKIRLIDVMNEDGEEEKRPWEGNRIGKIVKVFGDNDIALLELNPGLTYSDESFSEPADLQPITQPFRGFRDPSKMKHGSNLFINTPFNGQCEGVHIKTQWALAFEADDDNAQGIEKIREIGHFTYFGNGSHDFLGGCCGGVIWDINWEVVGQFRFQERGGQRYAYSVAFEDLRLAGYQLSTI